MTGLWWIIHKDLTCRVPGALRLADDAPAGSDCGAGVQPAHGPASAPEAATGRWLVVVGDLLRGVTAIDRSFASEHEDGCWDGLRLFPVSPVTVYWAKMLVNALAVAVLQCLLFPLFFVLSGLPLTTHPGQLLLIAVLGNLGIVAVGTFVSALGASLGRGGNLLVLLILPLVIPVLLAAAEATRLLIESRADETWWRWVQLLGAFVIVFSTAGTLLFEYAVEE